MDFIGVPMGAVMRLCYQAAQNYGLAIILFTLVTKAILFPVSLWVHANGVKMVRIQPAINRLKIRFFGDKDAIADEQTKLYRQEKYNPFSGIVPIVVQLILLIGLIQVIYHPLSYVLRLPADTVGGVIQAANAVEALDQASSSAELLALNRVQTAAPEAFLAVPGMTEELLGTLRRMNLRFWGFDLAGVPMTTGGALLLIPLLAALASVALSLCQNRLNPLQAQQGKAEQLGAMLFSVGISLALGFMIPAGVGFYWIWSNLLTIVQQLLLNRVYPPAKHIDYQALEASQKELAKYQSVGRQGGKRSKEEIRREKADYKRFFSILNKHLVFYSERSGYYKYFEGLIQSILNRSNLTVHYVTSDPNDQVFAVAKEQPRLKPYYVGERKLITLFMKLEADVVVMTMPEIEKYHYKRSLVDKNIDYVYVFHAMVSTHMIYRPGSFDHYDTVFCVGPHHRAEIRETEALYRLPAKRLVDAGYPLLDTLRERFAELKTRKDGFRVLIAPSHHEGNIMDSCLEELLSAVLGKGWEVIVRPHPQYFRRNPARLEELGERYAGCKELRFETDFSNNDSIYLSDVLITDWSGISMEYSFTTLRPCVFINTPMKVLNPEYQKLSCTPIQLAIRDQIGVAVELDQVSTVGEAIARIQNGLILTEADIAKIVDQCVYAQGTHGEEGAKYIIREIQERCNRRGKNKEA